MAPDGGRAAIRHVSREAKKVRAMTMSETSPLLCASLKGVKDVVVGRTGNVKAS
jgi:hypothetical protein